MSDPLNIFSLFDASKVFVVPSYQRAYAWEEEHLIPFFNDILTQPSDKTYYLGAILLEKNGELDGLEKYNVVDGQQRMTTTVIFVGELLMALKAAGKDMDIIFRKARRAYISDEDIPKFRTIIDDDAFFDSYIRNDNQPTGAFSTLSQERLWNAKQFFRSKLQGKDIASLESMLKTINGSRIIVYTVNTPGEATQIFELNNDRGKQLTQLEALKTFLMHNIYLYAEHPESNLLKIQGHFSDIFRICERLERPDIAIEEDSVLIYHAAAFEGWTRKDSDGVYVNPKDHIKSLIVKKASLDRRSAVDWIVDFSRRLKESFEIVRKLMEARDTLKPVAGLFLLGRMAAFWPLLLKVHSYDQVGARFTKATSLMEIFSFRAYAIANLKSDAAISTLYRYARDFAGDFEALNKNLIDLATTWYDIDNRFIKALDDRAFYYQGKDALYLFWKYENYLRSMTGQKYPKIAWSNYFAPHTTAEKLSLEHIAAQNGDDVPSSLDLISPQDPQLFREQYLHSLGNLVIDCHSANASKGNNPFPQKQVNFANAPLMSQNELITFVSDKKSPRWDENAINKRAEAIKVFALSNWDPNKL